MGSRISWRLLMPGVEGSSSEALNLATSLQIFTANQRRFSLDTGLGTLLLAPPELSPGT